MAIDDDQRRSVVRVFECREGALEQVEIVGVAHSGHVPAVAGEARCDVIAIGQGGVAFNGDVVVVVDPTQVGEFEVTRQRCSLVGQSLHQATIAAQRVDIVIKQGVAGTIEISRRPTRSDGHADAGGYSLAQGAGRRLDASSPTIFRVSWAFAVELAKTLDVVQRHREFAQHLVLAVDRFDAGEMQHRIEQHGGVASR